MNAWAIRINQNERTLPPLEEAVEEIDSENDALLGEIRKNMASASVDTLRRLQIRKRSHSPTRNGRNFPVRSVYPLDPMQIDFAPTVMDQSELKSSRHPKDRRTTSRSTSTSTSHPNSKYVFLFQFFASPRCIIFLIVQLTLNLDILILGKYAKLDPTLCFYHNTTATPRSRNIQLHIPRLPGRG